MGGRHPRPERYRAADLLRQGQSLADVARECGYTVRHLRRLIGPLVTPPPPAEQEVPPDPLRALRGILATEIEDLTALVASGQRRLSELLREGEPRARAISSVSTMTAILVDKRFCVEALAAELGSAGGIEADGFEQEEIEEDLPGIEAEPESTRPIEIARYTRIIGDLLGALRTETDGERHQLLSTMAISLGIGVDKRSLLARRLVELERSRQGGMLIWPTFTIVEQPLEECQA